MSANVEGHLLLHYFNYSRAKVSCLKGIALGYNCPTRWPFSVVSLPPRFNVSDARALLCLLRTRTTNHEGRSRTSTRPFGFVTIRSSGCLSVLTTVENSSRDSAAIYNSEVRGRQLVGSQDESYFQQPLATTVTTCQGQALNIIITIQGKYAYIKQRAAVLVHFARTCNRFRCNM